jgi:hypothetical protein
VKVDKKAGLEEKLKEKPEMDSGTPQQGDERGCRVERPRGDGTRNRALYPAGETA